MKFWEAMKALEEGKTVRNINWTSRLDGSPERIDKTGFNLDETDFDGEWEIYEGVPEMYSFPQIIRGFREGKGYKRKAWDDEDVISCNIRYPDCFVANSAEAVNFCLADLEATDWVEVK